jgi:hypothetical protein
MEYTKEEANALQREMYFLWGILAALVAVLMVFTLPLHKALASKH